MPGNYYDDGPSLPPSTPSQQNQDSAPEEAKDDEAPGEVALLPKSILAGKEFKPGDEVVLKIVAMHGDEVQVAYAPEKPDEQSTPEDQGATSSEMEPKDPYASMME